MNNKIKYISLFEEFVKKLNEKNKNLAKISGGCDSTIGIKLMKMFDKHPKYFEDIEEYMGSDNYKELKLGDAGYVDLNEIDIDKDKILFWFSKLVLGNGMIIGKGEVLLSILYKNIYKTEVGNSDDEVGDLYISNDGGKTRCGRIEVKSALPGGFAFNTFIREEEIKTLKNGDELWKAYNNMLHCGFNCCIDKNIYIELCAYCIARYIHGQFKKSKNHYLVIFDNQPHITSKGTLHGSLTRKIKYVINKDGSKSEINESYLVDKDMEDIFNNPVDLDDEMNSWAKEPEVEEKEDDISVHDLNGFIYIKRCDSVELTKNKILEFIDVNSYIYKENKNNNKNNFTFYVKDKKICIAHKECPILINNEKKGEE